MKIIIFMLESLISNKKENKNVAPSPPWTPLANFFFEFLILILKCWCLIWGPIYNNKEKQKFWPPRRPSRTPLAKQYFFKISFMYMEILIFKFERPISNNKGNRNFATRPPRDAPGKKYFLNIFDVYGNFSILVWMSYL